MTRSWVGDAISQNDSLVEVWCCPEIWIDRENGAVKGDVSFGSTGAVVLIDSIAIHVSVFSDVSFEPTGAVVPHDSISWNGAVPKHVSLPQRDAVPFAGSLRSDDAVSYSGSISELGTVASIVSISENVAVRSLVSIWRNGTVCLDVSLRRNCCYSVEWLARREWSLEQVGYSVEKGLWRPGGRRYRDHSASMARCGEIALLHARV